MKFRTFQKVKFKLIKIEKKIKIQNKHRLTSQFQRARLYLLQQIQKLRLTFEIKKDYFLNALSQITVKTQNLRILNV